MKKLLIGFLAVGLIMGFAMTASAQPNIKASGQLYMYGSYSDNMSLIDNGDHRANVANRLRMQFEIQIQEGLKLTTRFDALERAWGQTGAVLTQNTTNPLTSNFIYTRPEQNISFERAYVTFNALYGVFDVGYQQSRIWGTCTFCDDYDTDAGIHYRYMMGPWTFGLEWEKRADASQTSFSNGLYPAQAGEGSPTQGGINNGAGTFLTTLGGSDNDHDIYHIYAIYRWATGQAGLRYEYDRDASAGTLTYNQALTLNGVTLGGYTTTFNEIAPYVQWKFGPFDIESELRYIWGKIDRDAADDIDRKGYSFYLNGKYTMAAFYGGLEFAYITGDDPGTTDKWEAGVAGGQAWDPLLMFGNYWFTKYHGAMGGQIGPNESNLIMFKPYVGWKVNPQLEVVMQYAWLKAQEKPSGYVDDMYGSEFDIYANYKIYNNLTYTVGFGYFSTGDYFKGTNAAASLDDNFMFMNALNLAF
jgi:hypothetical protein